MSNTVHKVPDTHDYTRRHWGHDFSVTHVENGGHRLHMVGWGLGIKEGDFLILPNKGHSTRYIVESVKYHQDPTDMWTITAIFSPRVTKT